MKYKQNRLYLCPGIKSHSQYKESSFSALLHRIIPDDNKVISVYAHKRTRLFFRMRIAVLPWKFGTALISDASCEQGFLFGVPVNCTKTNGFSVVFLKTKQKIWEKRHQLHRDHQYKTFHKPSVYAKIPLIIVQFHDYRNPLFQCFLFFLIKFFCLSSDFYIFFSNMRAAALEIPSRASILLCVFARLAKCSWCHDGIEFKDAQEAVKKRKPGEAFSITFRNVQPCDEKRDYANFAWSERVPFYFYRKILLFETTWSINNIFNRVLYSIKHACCCDYCMVKASSLQETDKLI